MLQKIKDIKDNHPWAFWVVCVVLFPIGIGLFVFFTWPRKQGQDQELLDTASRAQGAADAHQGMADAHQGMADEGIKQSNGQVSKVRERLAKMRKARQNYNENVHKPGVEDAGSWAELDKTTNAKDGDQ